MTVHAEEEMSVRFFVVDEMDERMVMSRWMCDCGRRVDWAAIAAGGGSIRICVVVSCMQSVLLLEVCTKMCLGVAQVYSSKAVLGSMIAASGGGPYSTMFFFDRYAGGGVGRNSIDLLELWSVWLLEHVVLLYG